MKDIDNYSEEKIKNWTISEKKAHGMEKNQVLKEYKKEVNDDFIIVSFKFGISNLMHLSWIFPPAGN